MFIPGETISHEFIIPFVRSDITRAYLTYYQDDRIIVKRSIPGAQIRRRGMSNESSFTITLAQEESLMFKNNGDYRIQLNFVFARGDRCASYELKGSNGVQHIIEAVNVNG